MLHGLDVPDAVVRGDGGQGVGDVVWEVVPFANRAGQMAGIVVALEDEQGHAGRVATDRRLGLSRMLLERPVGIAAGTVPVRSEKPDLHGTDQAAPASRRSVGEALPVAVCGPGEPLGRFGRSILHEECEPRAAGRVAQPRQLSLPRIGVGRVREARVAVPVAFGLPSEVLSPSGHAGEGRVGRKWFATRIVAGMSMSSFYGFELETAPGLVMTPRPTTEALVDAAVALAGDRAARIADVGTGSGAIAIALASRLPNAEIWASDFSPRAVELARVNAARHGFAARIHMAEGDLLDPIPGQLCLIVANLPYLPDELRHDPAYAEYACEPPEAIFTAEGGLALYRRLLVAAEERLDDEGGLVVQFRREILQAGRDELAALRGRIESEGQSPGRGALSRGGNGHGRGTVPRAWLAGTCLFWAGAIDYARPDGA
jgi:release factor glutamine methyltransferase